MYALVLFSQSVCDPQAQILPKGIILLWPETALYFTTNNQSFITYMEKKYLEAPYLPDNQNKNNAKSVILR